METYEILRGLREDRDLTQTQIGKILHMSQRKISYIESGQRAITTEELKGFCIIYYVSADYLLGLPEGLPYPKRR